MDGWMDGWMDGRTDGRTKAEEQYQVEISNRFAALEKLDNDVEHYILRSINSLILFGIRKIALAVKIYYCTNLQDRR
jgi:hypothetical protein